MGFWNPPLASISTATVGHSLCLQEERIAVNPRGAGGGGAEATSAPSLRRPFSGEDFFHMRAMVPSDLESARTNLKAAQLQASLNMCGLLKTAKLSEGGRHHEHVSAALSNFLSDGEREEVLRECSAFKKDKLKLKSVMQRASKKPSFAAHVEPRGGAPLRDFREAKIGFREIALSGDQAAQAGAADRLWLETYLLDNDAEFRSITSTFQLPPGAGPHKLNGLSVFYNLRETSGTTLRCCQDICQGMMSDVLVVEVWAAFVGGETGDATNHKLGKCQVVSNE